MTKRFFRHHSDLLAHLDTLEEMAQEISGSSDPEACFNQHSSKLDRLFEFMAHAEAQHEKEEERILLPLLENRLAHLDQPNPLGSVKNVCGEHDQGQQFVKDLRQKLVELEASQPRSPAEYYRFSAQLTDLIWHYRRHVWKEDSVMLSAAQLLAAGQLGQSPFTAGESENEQA